MNTNTGEPATTEITLTYDADRGYWTARDENRGVTAEAATRRAALEALDDAVAAHGGADNDGVEVDPEAPFFSAPTFSSGRSDVSGNVDAYLADDTYRETVAPDDDS